MSTARGPYTCIYREIWNEDRFWAMSDAGRFVYFYILTTPLGNGLGCFKAGMAAMAEDTRMPPRAFAKAFAEGFSEALGEPLYQYDEYHRVVYIPKYLQRNPSNNPNVLKSLGKAYITIPDCELKAKCFETVKAFAEGLGEGFAKAFAEAFPKAPGTYSPSPRPCPSPDPNPRPKPDCSYEQSMRACDFGFDTFWASYPRKIGRKAAAKAWTAAADKPPVGEILASIEAQKSGDAWTREGGAYIPHPATWLNQGRWADEVLPPRREESRREREARLEREESDRWIAKGIEKDREDEERRREEANRGKDRDNQDGVGTDF